MQEYLKDPQNRELPERLAKTKMELRTTRLPDVSGESPSKFARIPKRAEDRYDRLIKLAALVVQSDILHGHLKWKVTDISRLSQISRSRVYELLGGTKEQMIVRSFRIILDEIYGRSNYENRHRKPYSPLKVLMNGKQIMSDFPELMAFYFLHRMRLGEVGKMIRDYEIKFRASIKEFTQSKDIGKVTFIHVVVYGISLTPFLTDNEVRDCVDKLIKFNNS